ncbi:MAG: hypothetical protein DRJ03_06400 [Chloroflexi bacterium]|nr:MAG: hypothetical protein DRI81_16730 [Chloroflexota bacterium]RLC87305.1 MAG: hypothetical protein DRJ03_06400 [Chloroflexota bacterium]
MARYIEYQTASGSTILVEVEEEAAIAKGVMPASRALGGKIEGAVQEVQTRFEDAMGVVRENAQTIINKVKGLSDPPDEVEVTFGIKAVGEMGNFAVAKASAEANYTIKMKWKREAEDKETK